MSRSRKKIPIHGVTCAASDRSYKRSRRSGLRMQEAAVLAILGDDPDAEDAFDQQRWNAWGSDKDGKVFARPDFRAKAVRK